MTTTKLRIGDNVMVTTGSDKGKTGTIAKISVTKGLVSIEGINKKIKHVKSREGVPGERVEFFAPINISNVAVVDPKTKKPTKLGYKTEKGTKVRVAKSSGEVLSASAVAAKPTKTVKA